MPPCLEPYTSRDTPLTRIQLGTRLSSSCDRPLAVPRHFSPCLRLRMDNTTRRPSVTRTQHATRGRRRATASINCIPHPLETVRPPAARRTNTRQRATRRRTTGNSPNLPLMALRLRPSGIAQKSRDPSVIRSRPTPRIVHGARNWLQRSNLGRRANSARVLDDRDASETRATRRQKFAESCARGLGNLPALVLVAE